MDDLQLPQRLVLQDRTLLTVTEVSEVAAFDEDSVLLHTRLGALEVRGEGLQLKALSPEDGQLTVEGHICSLAYIDQPAPGGFWRRLLG